MHRLLYRPEEGAELLGISRARIFQLIASGAIDSVKIGRARRIPQAALERYVDSLSGTPTRTPAA